MEIDELKELMGNRKLVINPCSICGYPNGFLYRDGKLHYDSGCNCVTYGPVINPRDEGDALNFINRNNWTKQQILDNLV